MSININKIDINNIRDEDIPTIKEYFNLMLGPKNQLALNLKWISFLDQESQDKILKEVKILCDLYPTYEMPDKGYYLQLLSQYSRVRELMDQKFEDFRKSISTDNTKIYDKVIVLDTL